MTQFRTSVLLLIILASAPLRAALSTTAVFEGWSTGSDNNGGCFNAAGSAPGTDFSQQAAAQIAYTDLVIGGTTTQYTSAAFPVDTTIRRNCIQVISGAGCTTGFFEVTTTSGTTATVDRSLGTAASTCTVNLGGALATVQKAADAMTLDSHITWLKATAAYSISAAITLTSTGTTYYKRRIIGYGTTRGDATKPVIQTSAAVNAFTISGSAWILENLEIDGNSTGLVGVAITGQYNSVLSSRIRRFTGSAITIGSSASYSALWNSEIDANGGTNGALDFGASLAHSIVDCYIHDNTKPGIYIGSGNTIVRNIIDTSTGASSDCINVAGNYGNFISNNVLYRCGRDGIRMTANFFHIATIIENNSFTEVTGIGLNATAAQPEKTQTGFSRNAFFSNTGGNYGNINAGTGDVVATVDPYVDAPNGDFRLNTTAGGGAALRAAGFPGVFPGGLTTGTIDIGAAQHADPACSGGAGGFTRRCR